MKLIVAIIRPDRLNEVLEALYRAEVTGLTVSRVLGHGGETDRVETYRGTTVKMELQEKVRLDIGVSDSFVDVTVRAIVGAAHTGEVGDGKVFVLDVEQVHRIRTGERDEGAVTPRAWIASCDGLPARRPSFPAAFHALEANTPVRSAPVMPPMPWPANTSRESSSRVRERATITK